MGTRLIKNTNKVHPVITPAEMMEMMDAMLYDLRTLALMMRVPYRTVQNYAYGLRAIPADFALALRATMIREFVLQQESRRESDAFWAAWDKLHPHGIKSEVVDYF